jgi:thiol-disulfide isomerase/thioredoxin
MNHGIAAVTLAVASLLGLPALVIAEESAKPQAAATAGDADALWKQIEETKAPEFDASKQGDRSYVQKYFTQMQETAKKRVELAKQFVEKYPDHKKKPDALYVQAESLMQSRMMGSEEFGKVAEAFVAAAPKDERGARLLYQLAQMERDDAKQGKLLRRVIDNYPDSDVGKMAKGSLRKVDDIGKPFELKFEDATTGKKISMADLKGKVVVIDFWATWCGPCVAEMPTMKKLYAEYKDKGVEFIGVSLDNSEAQGGQKKLKEFVEKNQITWPQYYQGDGWGSEFSKGWGINSIPTVFIVDADGKLHSTKARGQLERLIPELLKKAGKKVS